MKWWILYYHEKRKNAEIRRTIQQTSYPTEESFLKQWELQPRESEEYDSQSIAHSIPKPDDSRATDNNGRTKWESIKRRCKGVATRDISK